MDSHLLKLKVSVLCVVCMCHNNYLQYFYVHLTLRIIKKHS